MESRLFVSKLRFLNLNFTSNTVLSLWFPFLPSTCNLLKIVKFCPSMISITLPMSSSGKCTLPLSKLPIAFLKTTMPVTKRTATQKSIPVVSFFFMIKTGDQLILGLQAVAGNLKGQRSFSIHNPSRKPVWGKENPDSYLQPPFAPNNRYDIHRYTRVRVSHLKTLPVLPVLPE